MDFDAEPLGLCQHILSGGRTEPAAHTNTVQRAERTNLPYFSDQSAYVAAMSTAVGEDHHDLLNARRTRYRFQSQAGAADAHSGQNSHAHPKARGSRWPIKGADASANDIPPDGAARPLAT